MRKSLLFSKTFWLNLLALLAVAAQEVAGWRLLPPQYEALLLAAANLALRLVTSQGVRPPARSDVAALLAALRKLLKI